MLWLHLHIYEIESYFLPMSPKNWLMVPLFILFIILILLYIGWWTCKFKPLEKITTAMIQDSCSVCDLCYRWSLLEKYSCKASKLHLKPRRFKIFIEALVSRDHLYSIIECFPAYESLIRSACGLTSLSLPCRSTNYWKTEKRI